MRSGNRDRKWAIGAGLLALSVIVLLILWSFSGDDGSLPTQKETVPSETAPAEQSDEEELLRNQCIEIALSYRDIYASAEKIPAAFPEGAVALTKSGIDAIEARLIQSGYATIDRDDPYPEYLANSDGICELWANVQSGDDGDFSYIRINDDGGFIFTRFRFQGGTGTCWCVDISWGQDGEPFVSRLEEHQVYDMELTRKNHFYYQIYPSDLHYADYILLHLESPDKALFDLAQKYILPVGYQGTNIFLCDWTEADYGELSFNDLLEYLYKMGTGEALNPEVFPLQNDPFYAQVPSALFEETILPYFAVSTEELKEIAAYHPDGDFYPWKRIFTTSDAVWYPAVEPELTQCIQNPDGTITLCVDVCCPDFKNDCFFSHEVTIRLLEDGGFQYVGNRVTSQTDYGLPPNSPRLSDEELRQ